MTFPLRRWGLRVAALAFLLQIALVVVVKLSDQPAQWTALPFELAQWAMWTGLFAPWLYNQLRGSSDGQDQRRLLGQLADFLRLGWTLPEAVRALQRHQRASWRSRFSQHCHSLKFMAARIEAGDTLGRAMAASGNFPVHWPGILHRAETNGLLTQALLALQGPARNASWLGVWTILRLLMLVLLVIPVLLFLTTYILPTFVALSEGMVIPLPWSTQALLLLERWSLFQWLAPILSLLVLLWLFHPASRRSMANMLRVLPPFSAVAALEDQALVARLLGLSLSVGFSESEALELAGLASRHPAYSRALTAQPGCSIAQLMQNNAALFAAPLRWLVTQAQVQGHNNLYQALLVAASVLEEQAQARRHTWKVTFDLLSAFALGGAVLLLLLGTVTPLVAIISEMIAGLVLP